VVGLKNRWAVLGLMFLVGIALPMQFQAVPALAPFLVAESGLNYTDIGVLTGLFMFPGVFLAIPGGLLAARIGDKLTLLVGLAIMLGSSVLFVSTDSYGVMFVSRLLGGAGAVLITVLLSKVVTDWFVGKEIATALATIAASFGVGIGLAMASLPSIAAMSSWQIAMLANASIAALAIVLLFSIYRDHEAGNRKVKDNPKLWRLSGPEQVLSVLAGTGRGLFSTGYVVFMSFLPPLLISQGMPVIDAGLLTSLAAMVSIVSVPLGGFLSDRTGKPNLFIVGGAVGTALTCVLVPYIAPAMLWILLFGFLRGGCTGGIMALPSQVLRPESRSTGFAISSATYFVAMAAFPPVAGYILDTTTNAAAPLWFAGILWLLIPVVLVVFKLLQRKWITQ
jgi:cyanate permease